jgi:hypothetical protein
MMNNFDLNAYMRANRTIANGNLVKRITCKDGFSISVQASAFSYSYPRENHAEYYSKVECGFPSAVPEFIMEYVDDAESPMQTVYGYVPTVLVEQLINFHGGVN